MDYIFKDFFTNVDFLKEVSWQDVETAFNDLAGFEQKWKNKGSRLEFPEHIKKFYP